MTDSPLTVPTGPSRTTHREWARDPWQPPQVQFYLVQNFAHQNVTPAVLLQVVCVCHQSTDWHHNRQVQTWQQPCNSNHLNICQHYPKIMRRDVVVERAKHLHLLKELHAKIVVPINIQNRHRSTVHPCAWGCLLNMENKLTGVIVLHPHVTHLAPVIGVVGTQTGHLIKRSHKQNESWVGAKLWS